MTYKVMIVDDSSFMRSELTKIIEEDARLRVVGTATNGMEAINRVRQFRPDVITMDINMPIMDGIEALKYIMRDTPLPVLMISALTHESADETIKALTLGAFDFFHKPSGSISLDISLQADIIREKNPGCRIQQDIQEGSKAILGDNSRNILKNRENTASTENPEKRKNCPAE